MFNRILFFAVILIVGVFACTPRGGEEVEAKKVDVQLSSEWGTDNNADSQDSWSDGETALERQGDGHFYADVVVNGVEGRFLVDTGASVVALTGDDAQSMGFDWRDEEITRIGSGASGAVYGIPVTLDQVELDGYGATSVHGVIIPEGLEISLLGQSFLRTIGNVSIQGNEMILAD